MAYYFTVEILLHSINSTKPVQARDAMHNSQAQAKNTSARPNKRCKCSHQGPFPARLQFPIRPYETTGLCRLLLYNLNIPTQGIV